MSAIRSMKTTHMSKLVLRCKVVIVGDATTGKTALTQMFVSGGHDYPKNYVMTSGVNFCVKAVNIPKNNTTVELYLFDCAGQSIFNQRELGSIHYENASMVMVVYDVNNRESFKSCGKWLQDVAHATQNRAMSGVLVANKVDSRESNREAISQKEGEDLAQQIGLQYFECSALQGGESLEAPYRNLADQFLKKYEETVKAIEKLN